MCFRVCSGRSSGPPLGTIAHGMRNIPPAKGDQQCVRKSDVGPDNIAVASGQMGQWPGVPSCCSRLVSSSNCVRVAWPAGLTTHLSPASPRQASWPPAACPDTRDCPWPGPSVRPADAMETLRPARPDGGSCHPDHAVVPLLLPLRHWISISLTDTAAPLPRSRCACSVRSCGWSSSADQSPVPFNRTRSTPGS